MKTKNIFRMLLVAAALLLGANNVKAGVEGQIWPANGADNTTDECSISNEVFINAGVSDGTVLRVYCGPITGGGGYFAILFYANGENPEFKAGIEATWGTQVVTNNQGLINNSYIDLTCSANTATKLKNGGFSATVNGITIKNVAIVEGSGSDGGDGGGGASTTDVPVWTGNVWSGKWGENGSRVFLDNGTFSSLKCDGTDVIRVYGTVGDLDSDDWGNAWFIQFLGGNWQPQGGWDCLNRSGNTKSSFTGYVNFEVSSEAASILKNNTNSSDGKCAILQGHNITFTSIVINPSQQQQQQPTTYTVTVNAGSNGSAYADKQNAASGEKVTIYTNPNSGYRVSSVTVTGGVSVSEETANTTYSFTMPANNVTVNVTFELETQGTPDQVVIGSTGYATYSNAENAINLSGLSGVKAYIATAISLEQNKVTLTQVSGVVAANTGLIFISENKQPGTFNLPIASSTGTTYNNNLLLPSYANTTLSPSDAWYTYYVLVQRENNSVKFAEIYSYDAQPGAGKAYLRTSKNQASARTRGLSIEISDGTTGINAVENEQGESVIYNLRGQRVENPTKGLYIINGKKVLIK